MKTKTLKFASALTMTTIILKKEGKLIYGIVKSNSIVARVRTPRKMLEIDVERERE